MEFRPCIDIHNGQVKQIVGGSLVDKDDHAEENFVAERDAGYYARLYRDNGIRGGHIILLNPVSSPYYEATKAQALKALGAYPGGLHVGGGVNDSNALEYLDAGASHVIVTSYVFQDGHVNMAHLKKISRMVGKDHLVLDLSCRMRDGDYYIVTDRWQKFTDEKVNDVTLDLFMEYCDEFRIHAVDVEGKNHGIEEGLVRRLGAWCSGTDKIAVTYAGGVHSYEDIELLGALGSGKINVTIGSALDIFGGTLAFEKIIGEMKKGLF